MDRETAIPLFLLVVLLLALVACAWGCDYATCIQKTSGLGIPSRYLLLGGCQIQENGTWIPLDNWRYFGD